ncbi:MAG: helix-turn-helix transcriptional regulator [Clostridia bacterium]|nr:helix-turn-helix transcriptional regulator [Clostridia bacterium]
MEVEYIKSLKEAKKLKVKDLAEMTGIPESTINNFLSRKTESPSFSMMSKLCIAVGGSLDEMIGLKEIVEKKAEEQTSKELLSSITDIYKEQIENLKERNNDLKEDKKNLTKEKLCLYGIIVALIILEFILGLFA